MQVKAYPLPSGTPVVRGDIAAHVWVNGFVFSEERELQVVKPMRAAAPDIYDRLTRTKDFSFAAGRAFDTAGAALKFLTTHAAAVPGLANLQFTQGSDIAWLKNCGIKSVRLQEKRGALVIFGYTIVGGTFSLT